MSLYHCDNPAHGYDCYHLDDLAPKEENILNTLSKNYGYLDTLARVDNEIQDTQSEQERAMERASELDDDLTELYQYRRLLEKKLKTSGLTEGVR